MHDCSLDECVNGLTVLSREKWCGVDVQTRLQSFFETYIEHDDLKNAEELIESKAIEIERKNELDENFQFDPAITYGVGVLLIGESGAGKSTFASRICKKNPPIVTPTATYLPAVYMRVPTVPTEKSMAVALLKAMKHPDLKGTADELQSRAVQLMRRCKVRRLIIDDFQDIPATRNKGVQRIGDWIRTIIDATPCVVIAMGTPDAMVVRDSNKQLQRRMQARVDLLPFVINQSNHEALQKSAQRWYDLMSCVDSQLPLAESSNLKNPKLASLLMRGTDARFAHLSTLLKHAIICAVEDGKESIEMPHFREAFRRSFGSAADFGNPFDSSYKGGSLTGPNQAFSEMKINPR